MQQNDFGFDFIILPHMLCIRYVQFIYSCFYFGKVISQYCCTSFFAGDIDPCLDGNFELLDSPGLRGGACKMQAGNVICDRSIRNGWYKVIHEDDSEHRQMLEGIVSPNYCGTSNPIWLNGKFKFFYLFGIYLSISYLMSRLFKLMMKLFTVLSYISSLKLNSEKKSCTQTKLFFLSITRRNSSSSCRWYCE